MATDTGHSLDVEPRKAPGAGAVALIGGLVSGGAVAAFSGDWVFAALGSGFVAAALCGLTAYVLGLGAAHRRRGVAAALAVLVVGLAVAQLLWAREALRQHAFRTAFGTTRPRRCGSFVCGGTMPAAQGIP